METRVSIEQREALTEGQWRDLIYLPLHRLRRSPSPSKLGEDYGQSPTTHPRPSNKKPGRSLRERRAFCSSGDGGRV